MATLFSKQRLEVRGQKRVARQVPSASLGQDASLSFVVIGRGKRVDFRL